MSGLRGFFIEKEKEKETPCRWAQTTANNLACLENCKVSNKFPVWFTKHDFTDILVCKTQQKSTLAYLTKQKFIPPAYISDGRQGSHATTTISVAFCSFSAKQQQF